MTPTMQFTTVHSRQLIDKALFSFGTLNDNGNTFYGYQVSCVGEGFIDSEHFMPLAGTELQDFINALKDLKDLKNNVLPTHQQIPSLPAEHLHATSSRPLRSYNIACTNLRKVY
jgi:hypothetical protein